jgi:hypothetical protein
LLDEENKIENSDFAEKQMDKSSLLSKIGEWSFYMVILFFFSFFVGTKIYQITMLTLK